MSAGARVGHIAAVGRQIPHALASGPGQREPTEALEAVAGLHVGDVAVRWQDPAAAVDVHIVALLALLASVALGALAEWIKLHADSVGIGSVVLSALLAGSS